MLHRLHHNLPCQTCDATWLYQLACCSSPPMADSGPDARRNNNLSGYLPAKGGEHEEKATSASWEETSD